MKERAEKRTSFEWSGSESPSTTVVTEVAEVTGTDAQSMTPLYEVVDPDALDSLFARAHPSTDGSIACEFQYQGYSVVLEGNGQGHIYG